MLETCQHSKRTLHLESEKQVSLFKDSPTERSLFLEFLEPQYQKLGLFFYPASEEYTKNLTILIPPLPTPMSKGTHLAVT